MKWSSFCEPIFFGSNKSSRNVTIFIFFSSKDHIEDVYYGRVIGISDDTTYFNDFEDCKGELRFKRIPNHIRIFCFEIFKFFEKYGQYFTDEAKAYVNMPNAHKIITFSKLDVQ